VQTAFAGLSTVDAASTVTFASGKSAACDGTGSNTMTFTFAGAESGPQATLTSAGSDGKVLVHAVVNVGGTPTASMSSDAINDGDYGGVLTVPDSVHTSGCTVQSHTKVECTTVTGVGANHKWKLTIGESAHGFMGDYSTVATSYVAPSIDSFAAKASAFSLTAMATEGAQTIVFTGLNFGPDIAQNTISGTYGNVGLTGLAKSANAANCFVTVANTEIECTTVAGVGHDLKWSLAVGAQPSVDNAAIKITFAVPVISSVAAPISGIKTEGGTAVTVDGTSFGPDDVGNVIIAKFQNSALSNLAGTEFEATCVIATPHTQLTCTAPAGVGKDQTWKVVVGDQTSASSSSTTSYTQAKVTETVPQNFGAAGGETVTLTGSDFGPVDSRNKIVATYGNNDVSLSAVLAGVERTAASCTVTVAHTKIECTSVAGVGTAQKWTVTVGELLGVRSTYESAYNAPAISAVSGSVPGGSVVSDMSSEGGEQVTMTGTDFGPLSGAVQTVVCTGTTGTFALSHGDQTTGTIAFDADAAAVTTAFAGLSTVDTASTVTFTTGKTAACDGTGSNTMTFTFAGTEVQATLTSAGTGGLALVHAVANNVVAMKYKRDHRAECPPLPSCPPMPYAGYDATSCSVTVAQTTIVCTTKEGVGHLLKMYVTVGMQEGAASTVTIAYAAPTLTGFSGARLMGTRGGDTVVVQGTNFGPLDANNVIYGEYADLVYNKTYTATCVVKSSSEAECVSGEGVGQNLRWSVNVGDQASALAPASITTSYLPPTITKCDPLNGNAAGGQRITLTGTNFGTNKLTTDVSFVYKGVATKMDLSTDHDHEKMVIIMPEVDPGTVLLNIQVSGQNSQAAGTFASVSSGYFFTWRVDTVSPGFSPLRGPNVDNAFRIKGKGFPVASQLNPANKFGSAFSSGVVQTIVCTGSVGTFTLSHGGQTTGEIAIAATAAQVQTAFQMLSTVEATSTVTFTSGKTAACDSTGSNTMTFTFAGTAAQATLTSASIGVQAVQTVACTGVGGTFTLSHGVATSGAIAFGATAAQVQTAFAGLPTVDTASTVTFASGKSAACDSTGSNTMTFTFAGVAGPQATLTSTGTGGPTLVHASTVTGIASTSAIDPITHLPKGIVDTGSVVVTLGNADNSVNENAREVACSFETTAADFSTVGFGKVNCVTPQYTAPESSTNPYTFNVEIKIDNADVQTPLLSTAQVTYRVYDNHTVSGVATPAVIPQVENGTTYVTLIGEGFGDIDRYPAETVDATCRFGSSSIGSTSGSFRGAVWENRHKWMYIVFVKNADVANVLQDHTFMVELNAATLVTKTFKADCSDLRVLDSVSGRYIPHWLEEGACTRGSVPAGKQKAKLYFRVPSVAQGTTTNSHKIYVLFGGNSDSDTAETVNNTLHAKSGFWAETKANPDATFELFDTFSAVDSSKWVFSTVRPRPDADGTASKGTGPANARFDLTGEAVNFYPGSSRQATSFLFTRSAKSLQRGGGLTIDVGIAIPIDNAKDEVPQACPKHVIFTSPRAGAKFTDNAGAKTPTAYFNTDLFGDAGGCNTCTDAPYNAFMRLEHTDTSGAWRSTISSDCVSNGNSNVPVPLLTDDTNCAVGLPPTCESDDEVFVFIGADPTSASEVETQASYKWLGVRKYSQHASSAVVGDIVEASTEVVMCHACPMCDATAVAGVIGVTGVQAVQTVVCTGAAGTFTLSHDGQTTGAIAFDADATAVTTAFAGLSTVGATSTVTFASGKSAACDGTGSNTMTFTFAGVAGPQAMLTSTGTGGTGGPTLVHASTVTGIAAVDAVTAVTGRTVSETALDTPAYISLNGQQFQAEDNFYGQRPGQTNGQTHPTFDLVTPSLDAHPNELKYPTKFGDDATNPTVAVDAETPLQVQGTGFDSSAKAELSVRFNLVTAWTPTTVAGTNAATTYVAATGALTFAVSLSAENPVNVVAGSWIQITSATVNVGGGAGATGIKACTCYVISIGAAPHLNLVCSTSGATKSTCADFTGVTDGAVEVGSTDYFNGKAAQSKSAVGVASITPSGFIAPAAAIISSARPAAVVGKAVPSYSLNGQLFHPIADTNVEFAAPKMAPIIADDFDYVTGWATQNVPDTQTQKETDFRLSWPGFHHNQWLHVPTNGEMSTDCHIRNPQPSPPITDANMAEYIDQDVIKQGVLFRGTETTNGIQKREIITAAVDMSYCMAEEGATKATITFQIIFNTGKAGSCTALGTTIGATQRVRLEYSVDGGTDWQSIGAPFDASAGYAAMEWKEQGAVGNEIEVPFAACSPSTQFRWIQDAQFEADTFWGLDSVRINAVPRASGQISITKIAPHGGPVDGGTEIAFTGIFPARVIDGLPHDDIATQQADTAAAQPSSPLMCQFSVADTAAPNYLGAAFQEGSARQLIATSFRVSGSSMLAPAGTTTPKTVVDVAGEKHYSTTVFCVTPPYFPRLGESCVSTSKRPNGCLDCCFTKMRLVVPGGRTVYYTDATASDEPLMDESGHEFVYYKEPSIVTLFPQSGPNQNNSKNMELSESPTESTIFNSREMKVRFTHPTRTTVMVEQDAKESTGIGLLADFKEVGTSYGDVGMVLGSDAADYRLQALYQYSELLSVYDPLKDAATAAERATIRYRMVVRPFDPDNAANAKGANMVWDAVSYDGNPGPATVVMDPVDPNKRLWRQPNPDEWLTDAECNTLRLAAECSAVKLAYASELECTCVPFLYTDIDRVQLKISAPPLANVTNFRIMGDWDDISSTSDDLEKVYTKYSFGGRLKRMTSSKQRVFFRKLMEVGTFGDYSSSGAWFTFYLDNPVSAKSIATNQNNLLLEFSEAGSPQRTRASREALTGGDTKKTPSIMYQHVYNKRGQKWFGRASSSSDTNPEWPYDGANGVPTAYPFKNVTWDQRVPMIQFCLTGKACTERKVVTCATPAGSQLDSPNRAIVQVALNGQNFVETPASFYFFDASNVYYQSMLPKIGPFDGNTSLALTVPEAFPLSDREQLLKYQQDKFNLVETTVQPIDNIVCRFKEDGSDFVEYSRGLLNPDAQYLIHCVTPGIFRTGNMNVSISINGGGNFYGAPTVDAGFEFEDGKFDFYDPFFVGGTGSLDKAHQFRGVSAGGFGMYLWREENEGKIGPRIATPHTIKQADIVCDAQVEAAKAVAASVAGATDATIATAAAYEKLKCKKIIHDPDLCCEWLSPLTGEGNKVSGTGPWKDRTPNNMYAGAVDDDRARVTGAVVFNAASSETVTVCGSGSAEWVTEPANLPVSDFRGSVRIGQCTPESPCVKCIAPALEQSTTDQQLWTVRVSVNGQNFHGTEANSQSRAGGFVLYRSEVCPHGKFGQTYQMPCEMCDRGREDTRLSSEVASFDTPQGTKKISTECTPCPVGRYQPLRGKFSCRMCPQKIGSTVVTATTKDRNGKGLQGQISEDACTCERKYFRDPTVPCSVPGQCCEDCPTGGDCPGGLVPYDPDNFELHRPITQCEGLQTEACIKFVMYKNITTGATDTAYHAMPCAKAGYYKDLKPGGSEGIIEECKPEARLDSTPPDIGACMSSCVQNPYSTNPNANLYEP
jgi:hypothetical protein